MRLIDAALWAFFIFAGTFALASLYHDLRAGWARFKQITKELNDGQD